MCEYFKATTGRIGSMLGYIRAQGRVDRVLEVCQISAYDNSLLVAPSLTNNVGVFPGTPKVRWPHKEFEGCSRYAGGHQDVQEGSERCCRYVAWPQNGLDVSWRYARGPQEGLEGCWRFVTVAQEGLEVYWIYVGVPQDGLGRS